jgi:hypothetical protein
MTVWCAVLRTRRVGSVLILAAALGAGVAAAQEPVGSPFPVNDFLPGDQKRPSVAADASGTFTVVWGSELRDADALAVMGRRFAGTGLPLGAEFQVSSYATGSQEYPVVAADRNGSFLVAWQSWGQDGDQDGVFAQRYDAGGARLGTEFRVNTYTTGAQRNVDATDLGSNRFVIVWSGHGSEDGDGVGVFARCYAADGTPEQAPFRVNTYTTAGQGVPSVAADPAGNFVVVWQGSAEQDGDGDGIFGQRFDAGCAPRGGEFLVNASTAFYQDVASVAVGADGGFLVAWHSAFLALEGLDVYARRFDPAGLPVGGDFLVNRFTVSHQVRPEVAATTNGDFVVAWLDTYHDGNDTFFSRRFDAAGQPRGVEFHVVTTTVEFAARSLGIAGRPDSRVVMAYDVGDDVYGQRFGDLEPAALAADAAPSATSDGNGVLEPGEAVDLAPSWRNAAALPLAIDGAGLAFTGPPAPNVTYTLPDPAASYGTLASGSSGPCLDCYRAGVQAGATRPAAHWDALFSEALSGVPLDQDRTWRVHVGDSFGDVPRSSLYYRDVETLVHRGATAGCATGLYCPGAPVPREQMAAFVLAAAEPLALMQGCPPGGAYADVPPSSPYCPTIRSLSRRGVVAGCGGNNFCPSSPVTREQMAVFVLRVADFRLVPPACTTPMFADVPAGSPFCPWIEELARRGIVAGCGGGNYCPSAPVTREQMATFLTGTFGLNLYWP